MMHSDRVWCVVPAASAIELANKLTRHSWCCCCGFEFENYLWLNDATSGDGAQEYAVVRKPTTDDPHYRQVESITASWCSEHQMLSYINAIQSHGSPPIAESGTVVHARSASELLQFVGGSGDVEGRIVTPTLETIDEHGRCPHCA